LQGITKIEKKFLSAYLPTKTNPQKKHPRHFTTPCNALWSIKRTMKWFS